MHTRRRKTKQKRNTICAGHHYVETNTITYIRYEPSTNDRRKRRIKHICYAEIVTDITTLNSERKDNYMRYQCTQYTFNSYRTASENQFQRRESRFNGHILGFRGGELGSTNGGKQNMFPFLLSLVYK